MKSGGRKHGSPTPYPIRPFVRSSVGDSPLSRDPRPPRARPRKITFQTSTRMTLNPRGYPPHLSVCFILSLYSFPRVTSPTVGGIQSLRAWSASGCRRLCSPRSFLTGQRVWVCVTRRMFMRFVCTRGTLALSLSSSYHPGPNTETRTQTQTPLPQPGIVGAGVQRELCVSYG